MDYIMHFLTLFWKIIFAFIPPTGKYYNVVYLNPFSILFTPNILEWKNPLIQVLDDILYSKYNN